MKITWIIFMSFVILPLTRPVYSSPSGLNASNSPKFTNQDKEFLALPTYDLDRVLAQPSAGAKVGDELILRVTGLLLSENSQAQKEWTLGVPPGTDLQEGGWDIHSKADSTQTQKDFFFAAVPLKPGKLILPSLVLKNSSGQAVARTQPFTIEVASAIQPNDPKPETPSDLEPPVGLQFPWWIIGFMLFLGLLILGGVIYGIYLWIKKRKPKEIRTVKDLRTPDEIALAQLAELEKLEFLKCGDFKAHYFRVSEILKFYVGKRYRFDAPESTTQEMIQILEVKKSVSDAVMEKLERIFNRLDQVKFTDCIPHSEESARLIEDAKEFIFNTRRPSSSPSGTGAHVHEV